MKTNYTIEIQRRSVTPAQFLAYVRRRLKATGGDAFCGCLDLDFFAAGSEPNYDTERDGTHCISRSKPYSMQTYIRQEGRLYNEICEFEFDDEKTGHGYYYLIDAEAETKQDAETAPATEPETETAETTETAQDAERGDRIADITGAIRREKLASVYRTKQRTTARSIHESMRAGAPTVYVGYCDAWAMLSGITPDYYTVGVYGWNCDIYIIAGLTICTGYRGMVGEPAVLTAEYERKATDTTDPGERNRLLAEWIAANLDAIQTAREGARA